MPFSGFVTLEDTLVGSLLVVNTSGTPINADALPTFRVYGPNGFVTSGSVSLRDSGSVTNASNQVPIIITSTTHGLTTGAYVTISGVEGNTGANGTFNVTKIDGNSFSLDSSVGTGSYTTGGTWNVAGLYAYSIPVVGVTGFEKGENYQILFEYAISAVTTQQTIDFNVT